MTEMRAVLPDVNPVDFRQAMSSFPTGVNVLTVFDDDHQPHGMTATAFSSVSAEPPLVLVCVNRDTRTHTQIAAAGRFGVNVLGRSSVEVSNHCARNGQDKRIPDEWLARGTGAASPALAGAITHIDCAIHHHADVGTHTIFVGLVEQLSFGHESDPLVYFRGAYRDIAPLDVVAGS